MSTETDRMKRYIKRSMHALMLLLVAKRRQQLAGVIAWPDITDKPDRYPPEVHEHEHYMDRQHAYALIAGIEHMLHNQLSETSTDFQSELAEMSARFDKLTWSTLPGKPEYWPAQPHGHDQYATREELHERASKLHTHRLADLTGADQLVALARVLETGKPGQFLKRTRHGYAWSWPDTIIYQQPVSGGMAYVPPPPTAAQFLNAILISETDGPILADSGTYLQYDSAP